MPPLMPGLTAAVNCSFTQPLTRFSVKINAQAVRLAMIYMLKIYLINSIY